MTKRQRTKIKSETITFQNQKPRELSMRFLSSPVIHTFVSKGIFGTTGFHYYHCKCGARSPRLTTTQAGRKKGIAWERTHDCALMKEFRK